MKHNQTRWKALSLIFTNRAYDSVVFLFFDFVQDHPLAHSWQQHQFYVTHIEISNSTPTLHFQTGVTCSHKKKKKKYRNVNTELYIKLPLSEQSRSPTRFTPEWKQPNRWSVIKRLPKKSLVFEQRAKIALIRASVLLCAEKKIEHIRARIWVSFFSSFLSWKKIHSKSRSKIHSNSTLTEHSLHFLKPFLYFYACVEEDWLEPFN